MYENKNRMKHKSFYYRHLHETQTYNLENLRLSEAVKAKSTQIYSEFRSIVDSTLDAFTSLYPNPKDRSCGSFYKFLDDFQEEDLRRVWYLWRKYLCGSIVTSSTGLWEYILLQASKLDIANYQQYLDNGYDSIVSFPFSLALKTFCHSNSEINDHIMWCFRKDYPDDYNKDQGIEQIDDVLTVCHRYTRESIEVRPDSSFGKRGLIDIPGHSKKYNSSELIIML